MTEYPLERMLQERLPDSRRRPMVKSNAAANVIDLEAFRQKKREEEEPSASRVRASESSVPAMRDAAMFVPVWFCWVPIWAPMS